VAKFCFILKKSPYVGGNFKTLFNLADSALKDNNEVLIYLNYDAVFSPLRSHKSLFESSDPIKMLDVLMKKGAQIICSEIDIKTRGLDSTRSFVEGIKSGGLTELSEFIADTDRLITL
jgi:sulfur relay (sulfurtransferase) complex TusBCD TusD component (DsrE family)